ncbi:glycoside hydrolase family 1 protein [Candidatus Saccharibacteria bacterium]|nr:glycoside hydrolase family 1 protein [Candidatus Saccharibacteria bacterium]
MDTEKQKKIKLKFPKNFLWGASVSTHQVEGGNHNQWSVWELETAQLKSKNAAQNYKHLSNWQDIQDQATKPSNYVSGAAADHYNLYKKDFDIAKKLHFNALRSGIEWSRIEPAEGEFDLTAVEHYRVYFTELKKQGITPILTLWHWSFPDWFAKKGGFLKRKNVKYFVRYVDYIMSELGMDFQYIITINEPTVYTAMSYHERRWPPEESSLFKSYRVLRNLSLAHKQSYKRIKKLYPKSQIGIAHNCAYFYPGDNSAISKFSSWFAHAVSNKYFIDRVKRYQDFLGLNFYFANRMLGTRVHNIETKRSDLGWDLQPDKLQPLLISLYKSYNLPILVTESGVADEHDTYRQWWIAQSVKSMNGAIGNGVKMIGYIHWSLLDNFEWAEGLWPRFGLVAVNYNTQKREIRPSALWYAKLIRSFTETK